MTSHASPDGEAPSPFHGGELLVQARAGVSAGARQVGRIIRPDIAVPLAVFLSTARVAAVAMADGEGDVWATMFVAARGFLRATAAATHEAGDDHAIRRLDVGARPAPGDALERTLGAGATGGVPVGLVAIDFATRRRVRVNGVLEAAAAGTDSDGFAITVRQAYVNCPKYIQTRTPPDAARAPDESRPTHVAPHESPSARRRPGDAVMTGVLSATQRALVERADTCFVASLGPDGNADASHRGGSAGFNADASHRGGSAGFIALAPRSGDGDRLRIPDYSGNTMFNTLGNLTVDPRIGLVIPDFDQGRLLQLSGTARIDWSASAAAAFAGAERVLDIAIERVVEVGGAIPLGWSPAGASPYNPGWYNPG